MKDKLGDIVYFAFLLGLYIFFKMHSHEIVFEIFSCSYLLFLQLLERFSFMMSLKGWERLF